MKSKKAKKLFSGAVLGALSAIVVWILSEFVVPKLFYSFEARTYDNRVISKIRTVESQSIDDIVIIDIDGRSESELGRFQQWPRSYYPRIIDYLNQGGAALIGLDIIFVRDMHDVQADKQFVESIKQTGNVINALYFEREDSLSWRYKMTTVPRELNWRIFARQLPEDERREFRNEDRIGNEFFDLLNAGLSVGHVNFQGDADGVVRKIHLFSNFLDYSYASFAFEMFSNLIGMDSIEFVLGKHANLYSEGNLIYQVPVDEQGNMLINWFGDFQTFRYISFYDVLEGRIPKEYFKDKIVLVGTSLPGLFDLRSAPFNPAFPGVEIHANILKTLMTGNFVYQMSGLESLLLILGIGIIVGIIVALFSPLWSVFVIFLIGAAHVFAAYMAYLDANYWVPIVNPLLTLLLTFSSNYIYKYYTEEKGKRFIKDTFSHFVTQSVVDELLDNPDKIKLGGEKKECTVFFSDVAGFTTISEQLTPEALVRLLNEYLTQMTNIVFKHNGMLDKYEGDAIMAVFGAPIAHGNHAYSACAAALEMQEQLIKLRALWARQGRPQLHARCGINTGQMVVGNMGSENRFDYTVMGDAVNLGARLEPANKIYNTNMMIGENTYQAAGKMIIARELDLLRVKGKNEPVKVYELVGLTEKGIPDQKKQVLEIFDKGFRSYLDQNWQQAITYFKQVHSLDPMDGPAKTYVKRCEQFAANPPGKEWDGVFTMLTK